MKNSGLSSSALTLTSNMDTASVKTDATSISNIPGEVEGKDVVIPLEGLGSNDFTLEDDDVEDKETFCDLVTKAGGWIKTKIKGGMTRKMLYRRVPILTWLPRYNREDAVGDLVAGITVGLTVIPQSLAYSNIAGLPAQYGLYGSFLGALLYILVGSCKEVPMGPTAIVSLLTFQATSGMDPEYAILLCFSSGIIQLFMGIFGLGFVIDFVSGPVSSGFTSAVALIIVTSQIKDVLGIKASGATFIDMWISLFHNMWATRLWDTVLGVISIVILLIMREVAKLEMGPKDSMKKNIVQKILTKTFWVIGTSRNAIMVVVCGGLGYYFVSQSEAGVGGAYTAGNESQTEESPFKLIGKIPGGMPDLRVPPFGYTTSNGTVIGFTDMVSSIGINMVVLPLIALLENIAICKAFSSGKPVDATQELIAMGVCNIGNSFVQGFPGSGSLSRSAVNEASGVRTPLGGLYTGVLVIVALLFFTPYFYFIPKAALAAIIIAAVVFMVEFKVVKPMWNTKKSDLIPGFGTFIACLVLKLEIGIFLGIVIQILFLLYNAARPKIHMQKNKSRSGIEYLRLTPDRCLSFPSVDYVRNIVTKHSIKQGIPVVLDCSHIYGADFTAAKVIETLSADFVKRKQPLLFYNLKSSVVSVFEGLQPQDFVTFYEHDDLDELLKRKVYEKSIA